MKIKQLLKLCALLMLIGMNVSCDQITKAKVRENIAPSEIIQVIDSKFILTNVENTGAAMSLGSDLNPTIKLAALQIFPIIMLLTLFVFLLKNTNARKIEQFAMACLIGGGIGNIMDRIRFDSVTDFMFIDVGIFRTGIFNMADLSVTVGVVIILIANIGKRKNEDVNTSLEH